VNPIPRIAPMLIRDLASSDREVRARAAEAIAVRAREGARAAQDPSDSLRLVLEQEWNELSIDGRQALVDPLVRSLLDDERSLVMEIAAAALATEGHDGLAALLAHLDHQDSSVRSRVAGGAGLMNDSARWALPSLFKAATTERVSHVRGDIVRAISRIEDPMLFAVLTELLTQEDGTPGYGDLVSQVFSAIRDRRRREWPEANEPRVL
jgi:HEAT repeat protein